MDVLINSVRCFPLKSNAKPIPYCGHFYHQLLTCLEYSPDFPPVADLLRRLHGLDGRWVVVSPMHWQATHNDAMIVAHGVDLNFSESYSREAFNAFAAWVAEDGMQAHFHDVDTWLLRCDDKPNLIAKPVHVLLNRSMMPELQALDETLFWQRFMTECQMFFSAYGAHIQCSMNGVWLWGQGVLNESLDRPLICLNQDILPLATIASTNASVYPSDLKTLKMGINASSSRTVVLGQDLDMEQLSFLEAQCQNVRVRWYWNNAAYETQPNGWFSRIMEKIKSC